jgi:hypothetical protein
MDERKQLLLEQWKMASQFHLHTDNLAWQRASYFVAINGILLGVLGAITTDAAFGIYPSSLLKAVFVAIPVFGALISGVWAVVQKRAQLYAYYRMAQAKRAAEALAADGEITLTLHEKGLCEQDFDDPDLAKYRVYLRESWLGRLRTHPLIFGVAVFLMTAWVVLLPVVSWHTFRSAWVCVLVSAIPTFLWLWLVWDACLLPRMKRPTDQADD